MSTPQYALVGSHAASGTLDMKDGESLEVLVTRLVLQPLDSDDDDTIAVDVVYGREDADILVTKIQEAAESVPYVAEQVPSTEGGTVESQ